MKQPLVGKRVRVLFNDHAMGSEVMKCEILGGLIVKEDNTQIVIVCWDIPDADDSTRQTNCEYFSIVKSAIIELNEIKKGRKLKWT